MSTLDEIESAVEALPTRQQELLLRRLEMRLRGNSTAIARVVQEEGQPVLVAPSGAPKMTPEMVKAALADFP